MDDLPVDLLPYRKLRGVCILSQGITRRGDRESGLVKGQVISLGKSGCLCQAPDMCVHVHTHTNTRILEDIYESIAGGLAG